MWSMWRWSVPQQPPMTLRRLSCPFFSPAYSCPSSDGIPPPSSGAPSSSARLRRGARARAPGGLPPEPGRAPRSQLGRLVQLGVAHARGVRAKTADTPHPRLVPSHDPVEGAGMGAVDHEVGGGPRGGLGALAGAV